MEKKTINFRKKLLKYQRPAIKSRKFKVFNKLRFNDVGILDDLLASEGREGS